MNKANQSVRVHHNWTPKKRSGEKADRQTVSSRQWLTTEYCDTVGSVTGKQAQCLRHHLPHNWNRWVTLSHPSHICQITSITFTLSWPLALLTALRSIWCTNTTGSCQRDFQVSIRPERTSLMTRLGKFAVPTQRPNVVLSSTTVLAPPQGFRLLSPNSVHNSHVPLTGPAGPWPVHSCSQP